MTEEEFKSGFREDGSRITMAVVDAIEIVRLIDCLRAGEGCAVTICYDNPEPEGDNCVVVECTGAWVKGFPGPDQWHPTKSFFGKTVLDCLRAAHAEMAATS